MDWVIQDNYDDWNAYFHNTKEKGPPIQCRLLFSDAMDGPFSLPLVRGSKAVKTFHDKIIALHKDAMTREEAARVQLTPAQAAGSSVETAKKVKQMKLEKAQTNAKAARAKGFASLANKLSKRRALLRKQSSQPAADADK